ncbi:MAG TPA: DEAD/DEAH box helicase [Roseiflexaceae bacterium]|jgi:ATP-dependent RNA helicase RhlE|nr:DEAD/DEAH box helicase [Roseiflexaceae bacterium]
MLFTDFTLHAHLQRAIQRAGFTTPTPIQEQAIPIGLEGRDLIGTAQTGTGKTAAFVLPIVQRLLDHPERLGRTRALIVTPTRELAEQINTTVREFTRNTNVRSAAVYGGVSMVPQEHALRNGFEIIVACPGRLLDHIDRGTARLDGVEVLVLDEADRMLDMGFLPAVRRILALLPRERQTMLFSATFAPELHQLAEQTLRKPARVDIGLGTPIKTVAHALYPVAQHLKTPLLLHLLQGTDTNSVLIFTRTKHRANRVAQQVQRAGYATAVLHSNKSQNQRQQALDSFREGKVQILVATDIAARGLDVESISHVINYDIPDTPDAYIHRIGRTGRAKREGDALTLVTSEDTATCRAIERALKKPIERRTLPDFDYSMPAPMQNEFQRDPRPARSQPRQSDRSAPARTAAEPPRQQRRTTQAPRYDATQPQARQQRRAPAHQTRPSRSATNSRQNS